MTAVAAGILTGGVVLAALTVAAFAAAFLVVLARRWPGHTEKLTSVAAVLFFMSAWADAHARLTAAVTGAGFVLAFYHLVWLTTVRSLTADAPPVAVSVSGQAPRAGDQRNRN